MSAERNLNDTELLSAYIDGQLTAEERSALESRLQNDAELRQQLALLRATVDLIRELPQLTAPRDFTLTPQMVRTTGSRRVYTFSLLSAAAAIVLLFVGFGLLTMRMQDVASRGYSSAESNFEPGGDQFQIAQLPTSTVVSTTFPAPELTHSEAYALEDQIESGADLESAAEQETFMQPPSTISAPAIPQIVPLTAAAEDDTSTSTTGEEFAEDGRLQDTAQAEGVAPASASPVEAVAPPSQEGAGGMLAFQATMPPPTATSLSTLRSIETALPTESPSDTPTRSPEPTLAPIATSTPPPVPTAPADSTAILAIVLIIGAVILLVVAVAAVIINRRR